MQAAAATSGTPSSAQLLSHAAVAAAAFAAGGLCCQRQQQLDEHMSASGGGGRREPGLNKEPQPSSPRPVPTEASPLRTRSSEGAVTSRTGHRNKNSRKLFKGEESATKVYCAGTLGEFQGTIPKVLGQDDHVLEIGVSGGGTSALLRLACPNVLSIDIERKDWAAAVSEAGGSLTLLDAVTDIAGLRALPIEPTVLYVDLSTILGHDPSFDGIALLRQLGRVFRNSLTKIVVRSRALRAHATQFLDPHALPEYTADAPPLDTLRTAPALRGASKVYCCVGVTEYRKTISWLVHGDDCVLEIGCQGGITTDLIAKRVRQIRASTDYRQFTAAGDSVVGVVGVDVAKKSIAHARKNFPDTVSNFETCDGWDSAGIIELGQLEAQRLNNLVDVGMLKKQNWTVVYVDVSGLSGRAALLDALALVQQLRRCLKPSLRAVVIKSRCLRDFAVGFVDAQLLLEEEKHQKPLQASTEFADSPLPVPPLRRRHAQAAESAQSGKQMQHLAADREEEICEFEVVEDGAREDALPPIPVGRGLRFAGAATAVVADQKLTRNIGWLSWALGDGGTGE